VRDDKVGAFGKRLDLVHIDGMTRDGFMEIFAPS
jgi:hypothetical protein